MILNIKMVSLSRYLGILITMFAFVTSNVALNEVHAAKPHIAMENPTEVARAEHQHHQKQQITDTRALEKGAESSGKHHADDSASGCCAFACGGAVVSSHAPDLLPSAVLSRMPILVSESIRATKQSPHDRPPRSIESFAG